MTDLVVAAATPWGQAALAVVRYSGMDLAAIVAGVVRPLRDAELPDGRPRRVLLCDADGVFDDGVAVLQRAPHTYTGEDTLEVTCHGNPLIVQRLLDASCAAGARLARPGEFTRRAVVNGKMDLLAAEAVDQVARATTSAGLQVGRDGLDGKLGAFMAVVRLRLLAATAELEARLDYPADELALIDDDALMADLRGIARECTGLAETFRAGRIVVEGARVALVGAVNAGKSSLFNALLDRRRALVHDTPGTTRDVLEVRCRIDGLDVTLLDTAGERDTSDPVEAAGLALAAELTGEADLVVVVLRAGPEGLSEVERQILARTAERARVVVYNGIDRPDAVAPPQGAVPTSATRGDGVAALRTAIGASLARSTPASAELMIASARQRDLLLAVADTVAEAVSALPIAGVAVAADQLTRALEELDALTGADTREEVLDALFARFCIGK